MKFDINIFFRNLYIIVKFYKDRSIIDPTPHIRSPSENDFNAHNCPKEASIAMKFEMNIFYRNLNRFVKLYMDRFIIDPTPHIRSPSEKYFDAQNGLK